MERKYPIAIEGRFQEAAQAAPSGNEESNPEQKSGGTEPVPPQGTVMRTV